MNFNAFETAHITICDWRGKVGWVSSEANSYKVGRDIWEFIPEAIMEPFRATFAKAMTQDACSAETFHLESTTARVWIWSLGNPESAMCILTAFSPPEMAKLSDREQEYFPMLAQGYTPKELALSLDVSLNTVHSQLRNIREKLEISDMNKLISYATRYAGFIDSSIARHAAVPDCGQGLEVHEAAQKLASSESEK